MATVLCTTNYSALQQQKLFLLETLAREEGKGEQLSHTLKSWKQSLKDAEGAKELGKSVSVRDVKHSIRGLTFNLKRSRTTMDYLARNLQAINSQMATLEQYQWRMTAAECRRQSVYGALAGPQGYTMPFTFITPGPKQGSQEILTPVTRLTHYNQVRYPSTATLCPFTPVIPATSVVWPHTISPCDLGESGGDQDLGCPAPISLVYPPKSQEPAPLTSVEPALLSPSSLASWSIEQGFSKDLSIVSAPDVEQTLTPPHQHAVVKPTSAGKAARARPLRCSSVPGLEDPNWTTLRSTHARQRASSIGGSSTARQ